MSSRRHLYRKTLTCINFLTMPRQYMCMCMCTRVHAWMWPREHRCCWEQKPPVFYVSVPHICPRESQQHFSRFLKFLLQLCLSVCPSLLLRCSLRDCISATRQRQILAVASFLRTGRFAFKEWMEVSSTDKQKELLGQNIISRSICASKVIWRD